MVAHFVLMHIRRLPIRVYVYVGHLQGLVRPAPNFEKIETML